MQAQNVGHLDSEVQQVLHQVVTKFVTEYNPLAMVLVGSYTNGKPGPHSDLDIFIIMEDQDWRERGNYFIEEYEIEYFINPVKQIRHYFKDEAGLRPHSAHMFSHGIVLYHRDEVVFQLINEAKKALQQQDQLEGVELQLLQYSLDDGQKDLLNAIDEQVSLSYQLTAVRLFQRILKAFFRHHQTYMEKTTLLADQIQQLDPEFAKFVDNILRNQYSYDTMEPLITYTENLLGGKRPENWILRSDITISENE